MIKKKVCLIGSFAVGKTSLASRFVKGIFSEKYLSTVGVSITQKEIETSNDKLMMIVWDLAGEDDFQALRLAFLKGASGFIFVADGTREETLRLSLEHIDKTSQMFPGVPAVMLLNKCDLQDRWEIDQKQIAQLPPHAAWFETSAKSGAGVEDAFQHLAQQMLETSPHSQNYL